MFKELYKLIEPVEEFECPPPSEEMIFMKSDDNVTVARCNKIEPFDVFEIYDREVAFEQAKKMQDSGQNVSIIFANNGKIYIQILTENDLFVHF